MNMFKVLMKLSKSELALYESCLGLLSTRFAGKPSLSWSSPFISDPAGLVQRGNEKSHHSPIAPPDHTPSPDIPA